MKKDNHQTEKIQMDIDELYNETADMREEGATEHAPSQVSGSKQARKKKKRKKKRYMLKLLILVLVCVGVYFFLHSSIFDIDTIAAGKSERFTAEEIQKLAGLKKGQNLFEISCGDCEERLAENPYIKEAKVKRKLPSGIEITLKERSEAAVIRDGKEYVIIDASGIVLDVADKAPQFTLLSGITVKSAEPGSGIEVKEERQFDEEMQILNAMLKSDLYFKKIEISGAFVKAYINDKLYCRGKLKNLLIGMEEENLQAVLFDLNKRKIKKGVINIVDDQYYSFDKKTKTK